MRFDVEKADANAGFFVSFGTMPENDGDDDNEGETTPTVNPFNCCDKLYTTLPQSNLFY